MTETRFAHAQDIAEHHDDGTITVYCTCGETATSHGEYTARRLLATHIEAADLEVVTGLAEHCARIVRAEQRMNDKEREYRDAQAAYFDACLGRSGSGEGRIMTGSGCNRLDRHDSHRVKATGLRCYGMSAGEAYEAAFIDQETGDPSLVEYDRAGDDHMDDEHFASSRHERDTENSRG